jgi:hypothetical protein
VDPFGDGAALVVEQLEMVDEQSRAERLACGGAG